MVHTIYLWNEKRLRVRSLVPHLFDSLQVAGARMNPDIMNPEHRATCRWLHYGIGKGVTCPESRVTVFGIPEKPLAGLHGQMVQGFCHVDPAPLCYDEKHVEGFGSFVRWVFFADPNRTKNFLGINFSLALRKTSGVATSFARVYEVASTLVVEGVPPMTEVMLLDSDMCETDYLEKVRQTAKLVSIKMITTNSLYIFCSQK